MIDASILSHRDVRTSIRQTKCEALQYYDRVPSGARSFHFVRLRPFKPRREDLPAYLERS